MRQERKLKKSAHAIEAVIFGVVQGVGFRPFIYRLAKKLKYNGWVKNIGNGVKIHLESKRKTDFDNFFKELKRNKPPLSQLEKISINSATYQQLDDFVIKKTKSGESFVFISPDISVCKPCSEEMLEPSNRRFEYPFINCTDCGPRYTIVKNLPYDRKQTTMAGFKMCEDCNDEYTDPLDRRYHAQPQACPVCGPRIKLIHARTKKELSGGIKKAEKFFREGKILAVKGLGGFHLVCDPMNTETVLRLRKIKTRNVKPLALMARDLSEVRKYAHLNSTEEALLLSARRPIVLLQKKKDIVGIAPCLDEIGFMLPYTPLHYLLLKNINLIVATSSNKKDSPIMKDEEEGIEALCDYILTHNRPIQMRADDSVMKVVEKTPLFLRRARGYVPYPQKVFKELHIPYHVLALGGELKDTISVYKNGYVVTSQFLGDLDDYENFRYFEETLDHLSHLFKVKPDAVVTDLHPDFHSTRYAQKIGIPHIQVQHHFAHILAPLLEHGISCRAKVLGVAFDGYGYGSDGTAWGGEFLIADYESFERFARFKPVLLPGADLASKQPWRMALSYLFDIYGDRFPDISAIKQVNKGKIKGVLEMMKQKINSPLSSSCGRLFDAVSFIIGTSPLEVEFEAEAPMRLEAIAAENSRGSYKFSIENKKTPCYEVSFSETIKSILEDMQKNVARPEISARFHNTLSSAIGAVAEKARDSYSIDTVVLVGGVFLNKKLLRSVYHLLRSKGFKILRPVNYSPNDESISLGQIAYALNKMKGWKIK
jgi:hydrogenase maturation protein HypF